MDDTECGLNKVQTKLSKEYLLLLLHGYQELNLRAMYQSLG